MGTKYGRGGGRPGERRGMMSRRWGGGRSPGDGEGTKFGRGGGRRSQGEWEGDKVGEREGKTKSGRGTLFFFKGHPLALCTCVLYFRQNLLVFVSKNVPYFPSSISPSYTRFFLNRDSKKSRLVLSLKFFKFFDISEMSQVHSGELWLQSEQPRVP